MLKKFNMMPLFHPALRKIFLIRQTSKMKARKSIGSGRTLLGLIQLINPRCSWTSKQFMSTTLLQTVLLELWRLWWSMQNCLPPTLIQNSVDSEVKFNLFRIFDLDDALRASQHAEKLQRNTRRICGTSNRKWIYRSH